MNRLALLLAGCAVLGLAACDHPDAKRQREARAIKTIAKLDCPERQGELKRVATTADGLSCAYVADGAEVTLKLTPLNGGDAKTVLAGVETELKALMPAVSETTKSISASGDEVDINLPGVRIQAGDNGATIKAPGAEINAENGVAEVRADRTGKGGEGVAVKYILANENGTDWKAVGYEARGPEAGPLVVATVKMKEGKSERVFEDASKLLTHNVGGREGKMIVNTKVEVD